MVTYPIIYTSRSPFFGWMRIKVFSRYLGDTISSEAVIGKGSRCGRPVRVRSTKLHAAQAIKTHKIKHANKKIHTTLSKRNQANRLTDKYKQLYINKLFFQVIKQDLSSKKNIIINFSRAPWPRFFFFSNVLHATPIRRRAGGDGYKYKSSRSDLFSEAPSEKLVFFPSHLTLKERKRIPPYHLCVKTHTPVTKRAVWPGGSTPKKKKKLFGLVLQ